MLLASSAMADSTFDRELVVKNKSRSAAVENVLRQLIHAYENEDARGFLDMVNEDRFREDYLTFTDALYNDFRTYEIHRVDYWVDRVQADNVKQFLTVHWDKKYESLDSAKQLSTKGVSRFLFDEVNGKYKLIELAGNDLFGASLPEWTDETPQIPGQVIKAVASSTASTTTTTSKPDLIITSVYLDTDGNLHFTVKNQGTAASGACQAQASNSVHDSFAPISIPALPAGGTYSAPLSASAERVDVDINNVVDESNESNNFTTSIPDH
jgi:hypothetical protein